MTTTLHVGVFDVPHSVPGRSSSADDLMTTGELADILEGKYALFSQFVDLEFDAIEAILVADVQARIHALMNQLPAPPPFSEAGAKLTVMFKKYLETEEIVKSGVPGVPTAAALAGKNSRLKNKKGPRRPSFIDTSVLYANLKVWLETSDGDTA